MKNFLKSKNFKLLLVAIFWILAITTYMFNSKKTKIATTTNTTITNHTQTKSVNNNKTNNSSDSHNKLVFKKIIWWFNKELTSKLPLELSKKTQKWKLLFLYYKCLPYNKITDNMLSNVANIEWLKEWKNLLKKQYEKICNNLLYTQYPTVFVYNKAIVWSEDVLPSSLLNSLWRYLNWNELVNYKILKTFFSYDKIGIIGIIKGKRIWAESYQKIINKIKNRKLDKQTFKDLQDFKEILKVYLK